MRGFDLSPLLHSTVGFDHLARMLESMPRVDEAATAYPPYNIEKLSDDAYRVTMAVAGFAAADLDITLKNRSLLITGRARKEEPVGQYLHRGIAGRPFERRFDMADTIRVVGAQLVNGLLHVDLVREVPEALRPRTIPIATPAETAAPVIGDARAA